MRNVDQWKERPTTKHICFHLLRNARPSGSSCAKYKSVPSTKPWIPYFQVYSVDWSQTRQEQLLLSGSWDHLVKVVSVPAVRMTSCASAPGIVPCMFAMLDAVGSPSRQPPVDFYGSHQQGLLSRLVSPYPGPVCVCVRYTLSELLGLFLVLVYLTMCCLLGAFSLL